MVSTAQLLRSIKMQQFGGVCWPYFSPGLEVNGLISPSEFCDLAGDLQFDGMFDGKESGFTPWILFGSSPFSD